MGVFKRIKVSNPNYYAGIFIVFTFLFYSRKKSITLVNNNFALTEDTRLQYQAVFRPKYPSLHSEANFISQPGDIVGDIYVAGDPSIYYFSGRTQATILRGWALEYFLSEQWLALIKQLDSSKPPYIFIDYEPQAIIKDKFPNLLEFVEQKYQILRQNNNGIWYILKEDSEVRI